MNIRVGCKEDSEGIAKVQVDSYLRTYDKIFPPTYLEHFSVIEQVRDWRDWSASNKYPLYVAETNQEEIIGYAFGDKP